MSAQNEKIVDELFLKHFGVKGMKWGVNRRKAHGARAARLRKEGDALNTAADRARGGTRAHALRAQAQRANKKAESFEKSAASGSKKKTTEKGAEAVTTTVKKDARLSRRAPHKKQTRIIAKGGERQEADLDAIKAEGQKRKLKKSGVAAMSTKELRELTDRIRLEDQAVQLTTSKGKTKVQKILGREVGREIKEQAQKKKNS